jgi:hypothetical protein
MPTTTNFGWTTPADTDLVKDGAAAIRTLAGNIDTSLVDLKGGTTGQVLAKASNTDLDFTWSADAGIPATIVDAKGDLIVATAADTVARLAVGGTNGHVLQVDSSTATGLKWGAVSGGKVLQVVQATYNSATTIASTTMTDTGLSVTITPTSATSNILILVSQQIKWFRNITAVGGGFRLMRGATEVFVGYNSNNDAFALSNTVSEAIYNGYWPLNYLDSPATTSATTYKTQARVASTANSGAATAQLGSTVSSIIALEIGA